MKTLTRNGAAKELGVTSSHLTYWEGIGELNPEKIEVGDFSLIIYTPELMKKAKDILFQGKRRKIQRRREGKLEGNEGRGK